MLKNIFLFIIIFILGVFVGISSWRMYDNPKMKRWEYARNAFELYGYYNTSVESLQKVKKEIHDNFCHNMNSLGGLINSKDDLIDDAYVERMARMMIDSMKSVEKNLRIPECSEMEKINKLYEIIKSNWDMTIFNEIKSGR